MLRSILVAVDGSGSSIAASDLALQLALRHNAHVEALGIINSGWIQRPEPVPIGGLALKRALDLARLESARERIDLVVKRFTEDAQQAGAASTKTRAAEGNPLRLIEREATSHDLVAIGRDSMFDIEGEMSPLPLYVERIVRAEPRPLLIAPAHSADALRADSPVLVAFDASPASSRTLHMLALLGLAVGRSVHVVTIDADPDRAAETARQACELLARHDVTQARPIGLGENEADSPSKAILGLSRGLGAGMIAMGAYGRSGIREIFGSCTRDVLSACPTTLFLYH